MQLVIARALSNTAWVGHPQSSLQTHTTSPTAIEKSTLRLSRKAAARALLSWLMNFIELAESGVPGTGSSLFPDVLIIFRSITNGWLPFLQSLRPATTTGLAYSASPNTCTSDLTRSSQSFSIIL